MLTLSPGSVCDVCAEEYSPRCAPHCIPCGHVLCASCCHKIVEKTLPRLTPVCPFCREHFTSADVRLIRIDFSASGWVAPQRRCATIEALDMADHIPRKDARFPIVEPSSARTRAEARRLEDKVAKVAAKKCSVEEVSTLHKELQDWLTLDEKPNDLQLSSLSLSAALLRAILMNHFAHSEATKMARNVEADLKEKLGDMEMTVTKLDAELHKYQTLYTQKVQECQSLRAEISRVSLKSASAASGPVRPSSAAPMMTSESRRQSVSSAAQPSLHAPSTHSPLSRFNPAHARSSSASIHSMSRPTTPARSMTPSIRSETPMQSSRLRPTSPPPPLPTKQRTMSISATSPQKILRSYSDESDRESQRDRIHERWLPRLDIAHSPPTGKGMNYSLPSAYGSSPAAGRSRSVSTNAA
ncbi:hypothetical protein BJ138DRAFT_997626 [Hygrophoropsis aurantiaca]|uniref:Uncharacterized protein n=1 Tax=Hygrophoropsis aurantiaca TaxID=72124 RepID=A0ACB8AQF3_9AGAM|nr:hypothetical protein BJ138DRAFT_997626 [Hygrophoropsis aurantiaca]